MEALATMCFSCLKSQCRCNFFDCTEKSSVLGRIYCRIFGTTYRTPHRTVHIGENGETKSDSKFPDNEVITSKYTLLTFLPVNLFEQFRRIANFYFLCIAFLQFFIETPITPIVSVVPLIFVVSVSAIKQAYEDWLRHGHDGKVNDTAVHVLQNGRFADIKSRDIRVGDIVLVKAEEEIPCDLVILSSNRKNGSCYVTTANLDGETNIKIFNSPSKTRNLRTEQKISEFRAVVECQHPSADLYDFCGTMTIFSDDFDDRQTVISSLDKENLIPRGAKVKNTQFFYGCAVYTGQETKMALNVRLTSTKFSVVEKTLNSYLIMFFVLLICEILMILLSKYLGHYWDILDRYWYLPLPKNVTLDTIFQDFTSLIIIYNYIIPISLYVTLETVKFIGSKFIEWDLELKDPQTLKGAKCNSSDLNEELGQVEYLFADKTGTLTQNDMKFKGCSINGQMFLDRNDQLQQILQQESSPEHILIQSSSNVELQGAKRADLKTPEMRNFFLVLALCHNIQVLSPSCCKLGAVQDKNISEEAKSESFPENSYKPEFQATSPDEKAFLEACFNYGVVYKGVKDGFLEVSFLGEELRFARLHLLEFDSHRKRMSVIVKDQQGDVHLLCKGTSLGVQ